MLSASRNRRSPLNNSSSLHRRPPDLILRSRCNSACRRKPTGKCPPCGGNLLLHHPVFPAVGQCGLIHSVPTQPGLQAVVAENKVKREWENQVSRSIAS